MYRDQADLELLAELAGVLDQTVGEHGLSSGTYLVLRELATAPGTLGLMAVAGRLHADPDEVADLAGRLVRDGLAVMRGNGVAVTEEGRETAATLEERANVAMREYVLDRPHSATVYGLVASMQGGRFTVADLIEFLQEGPTDPDHPPGGEPEG